MIAPFIPFILAAHFGANESAWPYGPEYAFDLTVNSTFAIAAIPEVEADTIVLSGMLYCRPKGSDALSCRLGNAIIRGRSYPGCYQEEGECVRDFIITEQPFEIKFTNRGVDHLIVSKNLHPMKLSMLKDIASRFSIGEHAINKISGTYVVEENTTHGECNVTLGILRRTFDAVKMNARNGEYRIRPMSSFGEGTTHVAFTKKMIARDCSCYAPHFFGSYEVTTDPQRSEYMYSNTSLSIDCARITGKHFVSSALTRGVLGSTEVNVMQDIEERLTLKLRDAYPAKDELPVIEDPAKSSLSINSNVESLNDV